MSVMIHLSQATEQLFTKTSLDVGVAAGGMSFYLWGAILTTGLQWFALLGGAVLLVLRLWLVTVELRDKRRQQREEK